MDILEAIIPENHLNSAKQFSQPTAWLVIVFIYRTNFSLSLYIVNTVACVNLFY